MNHLPLAQLRSIVGGKPLTPLPTPPTPLGELFIRSISTDTRRLDPNCLFVALKGDNYDAHDFVPQLTGRGPIAALVEHELPSYPQGVYVLLVPSTKGAMGKLASHLRSHFSGSVIAVGGSNGKTSTKHLIDAALRGRLTGTVSPKSFNNDIGVPTTVFAHDPNMDYLVLEMGTNHHGELQVLSEMAQPDIAVITSISHEHLEGLGDLNGVRREEAHIVAGLSRNGLLVVNGDDPELLPHLAPYKGKRVTFGFGEHNDLFASNIRMTAEGTVFSLNASRREVFVPLLGRHTASNALAAIAVARRLGLSEDDIFEALAVATGPEMRQQLQKLNGVTILNDAYNANPASMKAAFETLLALPLGSSKRRLVVMGEMRELGEASEDLHRQMGRVAGGLPVDHLIFVGSHAKLSQTEAISAGYPSSATAWFEDSEAAAAFVQKTTRPGDLMLLKGSRGVKLENIAKALATDATPPLKSAQSA